MKRSFGFTLVEVVVVSAILSIIAAVALANINEAGRQSRDTDRAGDLRTLQSAIELYRQDNGRYPEACRGADIWSGQIGTAYECPGGSSQYIIGLAPEYISTLPTDPRLNGPESGYVYRVNADGSVYKLVVFQTVESMTVGPGDPLRFCGADGVIGDTTVLCVSTEGAGPWGGSTPPYCDYTDPLYQTSFGAWGGYARNFNPAFVKLNTEAVVCSIPPTT